MEEQNFLSFMENYTQYKEMLNKKLNGKINKIEYEECFLVDNYWFDNLSFYYKSYNNMKKYKLKYTNKKNSYFPKGNPQFIQSIFETINYINSKKKFTIINNKIMELLNQEKLKNSKLFKIYIGYQKLIIEDPNNYNDALLFSNPLDENIDNRKMDRIKINNIKDKNIIYESCLKNESCHPNIINNNNINLNDNMKSSNFIKLKIAILLFYYEKYIISSKNTYKGNYYFINNNWMNKFKNFIKYNEIYNLLKKMIISIIIK